MKEFTNPHTYGKGTRLSSAYTHGRDGHPCPAYCTEKTSTAYRAWKRGHDEWASEHRAAVTRPPFPAPEPFCDACKQHRPCSCDQMALDKCLGSCE
jgi:hypothetical protein